MAVEKATREEVDGRLVRIRALLKPAEEKLQLVAKAIEEGCPKGALNNLWKAIEWVRDATPTSQGLAAFAKSPEREEAMREMMEKPVPDGAVFTFQGPRDKVTVKPALGDGDTFKHAPDCYGGPGMRGVCTCKIKPGVIKFPETVKYNTIAVGEEETFETVITPKPNPSPLAVVREALGQFERPLPGAYHVNGAPLRFCGMCGKELRGGHSKACAYPDALTALDELEAELEHDRHREPELQDAREWLDAIGKVTAAADKFERERDEARAESERWRKAASRACRGAVVTPDVDPRPSALIELRQLADDLESRRDEAMAERDHHLRDFRLAKSELQCVRENLQQMLAAVRATGALSPGDDWVTAIPEALAELAERRKQVDQLQQSVDERNVEISGLRSTQNDLWLQVSALEADDAREGWTRVRSARLKHLESMADERDEARTELASMQREKVKAASGAAPEDLEGVAREICRAIQDSQGAHPEPSVVVATGDAMAWARDIRAHRCAPVLTEDELRIVQDAALHDACRERAARVRAIVSKLRGGSDA